MSNPSSTSDKSEKGQFPGTPKNIELKEKLATKALQPLVASWLEAMKQNKDFKFMINGESCIVPKEAWQEGMARAEYEIKGGEYEFELTFKWKKPEASASKMQ